MESADSPSPVIDISCCRLARRQWAATHVHAATDSRSRGHRALVLLQVYVRLRVTGGAVVLGGRCYGVITHTPFHITSLRFIYYLYV